MAFQVGEPPSGLGLCVGGTDVKAELYIAGLRKCWFGSRPGHLKTRVGFLYAIVANGQAKKKKKKDAHKGASE